MKPTLTVNNTIFLERFEETRDIQCFLEKWSERTRINGNADSLAQWDAMVLGKDYDNYYWCAVYSPVLLGRTLDPGDSNDFAHAFSVVFDLAERYPPEFVHRKLGRNHHQYCDTSIDDLFDYWQSRQQHRRIMKHMEAQGLVVPPRKI